jgi:hypothetical protein
LADVGFGSSSMMVFALELMEILASFTKTEEASRSLVKYQVSTSVKMPKDRTYTVILLLYGDAFVTMEREDEILDGYGARTRDQFNT